VLAEHTTLSPIHHSPININYIMHKTMPALSVNMQTLADIPVHKRVTTTATATTTTT